MARQTHPMKNNTDTNLSAKSVCQALVRQGLISRGQAEEVVKKKDSIKQVIWKKIQKKKGSAIGGAGTADSVSIIDVIAALNLHRADDKEKKIDEECIFQFLASEWGFPYKKIDPLKLDLNTVTTTIPKSFAMKHQVLPIAVNDGHLTVATSNPFNLEAFEDITRVSQMKVNIVLSSKSDITRLIDEFFGFKKSIAAAESEFTSTGVDLGNLEQYVKLSSADELPSDDQHIVKAVNHLFSYAIEQRSSDIHIEPKRDISLVRMRIDGILHTVYK
ncbi:MAG: type II/IV secretion system protein, partial [Deltaproteobacteria bacterium]|nr:type II/IV secretion system protein [Deltaproteobacteria bacterium]